MSAISEFNEHLLDHVNSGVYGQDIVEKVHKMVARSNKSLNTAYQVGRGSGAAQAHQDATLESQNAAKLVYKNGAAPDGGTASVDVCNAAVLGTLQQSHQDFVDSLPENNR